MQCLPDAGVLPIAEPTPAGHTRATAHLLWQQLPLDARLEHKDDAGQAGAVRDTGSATLGLGWLRWQQRGDDGPEVVADKEFRHPRSLPHPSGFDRNS